jgi:signal transduction histidine kinase
LEGIDEIEIWHKITADNGMGRVNYTNLSPGTYRLKVFASNNGLDWNSKPVELKIVITPPFWKTPLSYLVYALWLVLLLYFLISSYLKRHKHKIEQQQKEDLDRMKFRFFTNISHELRTPLTLIITPLGALLKKVDDEKLKDQLTGIYRNANDY